MNSDERIRTVLTEHGRLAVPVDTLDEDTDLFGAGMTSHASVNVMLALEAGELETLSPIRMRYTGDLQDLTTSHDDQDVLRTEVQAVTNKIINTTVGRVILNHQIPKEMPFVNGLLKKKGLQQLVQKC